jgi:hypothetical protein
MPRPLIVAANAAAAVFFTGWVGLALARRLLRDIWQPAP